MEELNRIDALFEDVCNLLGTDAVMGAFDEDRAPEAQNVDQRIKILEEYALKVVNVPGFDPQTDYIRFRKIRLIKLKRVHSLLVDVIKDKKRYTAALKKRISTGERDPKKWVNDVNEAVEIALAGKPVALCAVENRVSDYSRGIVEVFYDDDHDLNKGVVFVWGTQIADCRGPVENVLGILKQLMNGTSNGLTVRQTYGDQSEVADDPTELEFSDGDSAETSTI